VLDRATYEQPLLPPMGVAVVILGGRIAVRDGAVMAPRGAVITLAA